MNWYNKVILAQGVEQYLSSLGATPEIVQYILSQSENMQYLVNEFKKNPEMSLEQLEGFQYPQKSIVDPYTNYEQRIVNRYPEPMKTWTLVNLRKMREQKDWAQDEEEKILILNFKMIFIETLPQILDWVQRAEPNPEIASYTPEQAIEATKEWHEKMASKGEGGSYRPIDSELIEYGPKWENPKWDGWTIQRIMNENDLLIEGNKMNQCVGSYWSSVKSKRTIIYSLRDPGNNPHITIETDSTGKIAEQISGNSNSTPKDEYRAMIKEWIESDKNTPEEVRSGHDPQWSMYGTLDEISDKLYDLQSGYSGHDEDDYELYELVEEYGLEPVTPDEFTEWLSNFDIEALMEIIFEQVIYEYTRPEDIEYNSEAIIESLISTVKHFDEGQGTQRMKMLIGILKEQLSHYPTMLEPNDKDSQIQKSFAQQVLNKIYEPIEQKEFNFSSGKSWYKKIILAQGVEQFLSSLGATPEIVQYILSQGENMQYLVNEFKKNPEMSLEQLEGFQYPQKSIVDPYLERERQRATVISNDSVFQQWVLISYRERRKGILPPENNISRLNEVLKPEEQSEYLFFDEMLDQIADWYNAIHPNITQYSPERAIEATNEWHRMMAGKGEGKEYEPTDSSMIFYGPEWKNPEWSGWTIQQVFSENDLLAEGNKMNHCIGAYCEDVKSSHSLIFSLRDPQNKPHVTIDGNEYGEVSQIQGHSNSIPKPEYRAMIKEWIESDKNPGLETFADEYDPFSEISSSYGTAEEILDAIDKTINSGYGLLSDTATDAIDIMKLSITLMNRSREPSYWGDHRQIPEASIDMMLKIYEKDPEALALEIKNLEEKLYKMEEENWDWAITNWDMSYVDRPNEEDYATQEEFEIAEEKAREEETNDIDEALRKTPEGGYAHDAITYINKLREAGRIPELKETVRASKKNSKVSKINWYQITKIADISNYDRDRLESTGHDINETVRMGDYNLTLVTLSLSPILKIPQVALTYKGLNFTDPRGQFQRREMLGVPNLDLEGIRDKLNEWISIVGKLYFSTHNINRISTYESILNHLGFNVKSENIFGQPFLTIGNKNELV